MHGGLGILDGPSTRFDRIKRVSVLEIVIIIQLVSYYYPPILYILLWAVAAVQLLGCATMMSGKPGGQAPMGVGAAGKGAEKRNSQWQPPHSH